MLRHLESCTSHATPSSFIPGLHGSDECLHLRQFIQSLQAGENSRPDTIAPHGRGNRQSDPGSSIVISLDIHNPDGASCRMNNPCVTGQHSAASKLHSWRRSEAHTSELQSLMRISYAVFCLKKTKT